MTWLKEISTSPVQLLKMLLSSNGQNKSTRTIENLNMDDLKHFVLLYHVLILFATRTWMRIESYAKW